MPDISIEDSEQRLAPPTDSRDDGAEKTRRPLLTRNSFALAMFLMTVVSTTWAGLTAWAPDMVLYRTWESGSAHVLRRCLIDNWNTGLQFSAALLSILLMHEFGHYCMMRYYGIRSTLPIFIPFPFNPFGTCGAIILMDPSQANRKQIFDIGLAGPLAGLVVAVPLAIVGLLDGVSPAYTQPQSLQLGQPMLIALLDQWLGTKATLNSAGASVSMSNPWSMAAWIGLLITGINMTPLSQLDGGHVAYGLLGKRSAFLAKFTFGMIIAFMIAMKSFFFAPMLLIILLIGLSHPPSSDDSEPIGPLRIVLGVASLTLPILCIPANPFVP